MTKKNKEDEKNGMYLMTLQECKDQAAKKRGYTDFDEFIGNYRHVSFSDYELDEAINEAAEMYASQFKPSGVKTFTVEDMEEAFMAGMNANEYDQWVMDKYTFEEWIEKYKAGSL